MISVGAAVFRCANRDHLRLPTRGTVVPSASIFPAELADIRAADQPDQAGRRADPSHGLAADMCGLADERSGGRTVWFDH
jgi:hypothetical protein